MSTWQVPFNRKLSTATKPDLAKLILRGVALEHLQYLQKCGQAPMHGQMHRPFSPRTISHFLTLPQVSGCLERCRWTWRALKHLQICRFSMPILKAVECASTAGVRPSGAAVRGPGGGGASRPGRSHPQGAGKHRLECCTRFVHMTNGGAHRPRRPHPQGEPAWLIRYTAGV